MAGVEMALLRRLRQTARRPALTGRAGSAVPWLTPGTALTLAALVAATSLAAIGMVPRDANPFRGLPDFVANALGQPRAEDGVRGWRAFENGVSRSTPWGQETIAVGPGWAAHYLTVHRHRGVREWTLPLAPHGAADVVPPIRVLDATGRNVTPSDLTWSFRKDEAGWRVHVLIDDEDLPLPYVIEPLPATTPPHPLR